jgi:hypothetical protein
LKAETREDKMKNLELAFRVAEEQGGVYRLLDPEDLLDLKVPDKKSVITYLSAYVVVVVVVVE